MVAKNAMHSSAGAEAGEAVGVPQLKFFSHSQIMPYFLSRKQACFSYEIACYTAIIYPLWKEKTQSFILSRFCSFIFISDMLNPLVFCVFYFLDFFF